METFESTPQQPYSAVTPPLAEEHHFVFDARLYRIYLLQLLNTVMNILTLGVYVFWGRTRIRRYLVHSFSLDGDRLEYVGRGGELFKGFLKSLPIILPLFLGLAFWDSEQDPWANILLIPLFYLIAVAQYAALRYRISRTSWRGIRGKLGGSALRYGGYWLWLTLLNLLTLGLLMPIFDRKLYQYKVRQASWGNQPLRYEGRLGPLMKSHLITGLLIPLTLGISRVWYRATLMRETVGNTWVEQLRLRSEVTGRKLFKLLAGNGLIVMAAMLLFSIVLAALGFVFGGEEMLQQMQNVAAAKESGTLSDANADAQALTGLLTVIVIMALILASALTMPWILYRKIRFIARNIWVEGNVQTAHVVQSDEPLTHSGEGLDSALGLDTGFL